MAQAQEKTFQALAAFALIDHRTVSCPDQIAHRFILFVGDVNGAQLSGPE
jgi:hypothetical protein